MYFVVRPGPCFFLIFFCLAMDFLLRVFPPSNFVKVAHLQGQSLRQISDLVFDQKNRRGVGVLGGSW